jgi:hypothetical protein
VFNGGSDQFLDSRISYSRSSTGTAFSSEKHLSSENLLPYSNDLSNSAWFSEYVSVASAAITAPDSSSTASDLRETAHTGLHTFNDQYTSVAGVSYTHTVFAKANGRTAFTLYTRDANATFDLSASTVVNNGMDSVSITAIGSTGWYKCVATQTATNTLGILQVVLLNSGAASYLGETDKGIYFWGMQASSLGEQILNPTSGSIHRSFAPTLKSYSSDQPRFEFDPASDGQSEGLLIEAQKSNLALNSNDYTAASWNKQRVTVTPSAAIGPDGQLSASLIAENTDTTTIHFMLPTAAITSGYSVGADKSTHSVFAKYAGRNLRMTDGYNPADGGSTIFDLQNGTVVSGGGSIQSCGNGWYRCSVTMTMSASTLLLPYIQLVDGTTWPNSNNAGDGYSGILIYGLQTEQQSMSSYVASGSASVSRASDSCSVALSDVGITSGQDLTAVVDGLASTKSGSALIGLDDGTSSNFVSLRRASSSTDYLFEVGTNGATQVLQSKGSSSTKFGLRLEKNNTGFVDNGGSSSVDASCILPLTTNLRIGYSRFGTQANGTISRVSIYSEPLSDTNLTALTSS